MMTSNANPGGPHETTSTVDSRQSTGTGLFNLWMVLGVWGPIVVITLCHYGTGGQHVWIHNVLRRLYYLPIVVAAFQVGLRGGLVSAAVVSAIYVPHAFLPLGHLAHTDPAPTLEKALEVVLYHLVGGVSGYLSDTARRRLKELRAALDEQLRLRQQLVRAGRLSALGEVVAGMAHEIRNPLHALRGTAEIVDAVIPRDRDERRMWEIHLAELERLDQTAERFLSFAKPSPPALRELDLREVAQRLVALVGTDARKKGVTMRVELPDEPVRVRGDRDQLAQVGLNIAVNALRAIGERGGCVLVSVVQDARSEGPSMHALRIENDGPPIAAEMFDRLFDPFHGDGSGGAGLGLSISERIVEQHGGFIEAANEGLGVTFTILLPTLP